MESISGQSGILLLAHGSPVAGAAGSLRALAKDLEKKTGVSVELAFLDFTPPSIAEGIRVCYQKGIRKLSVLPYFLSEGFLMRKAVQQARDAALQLPGLELAVGNAIGYDKRMAQILANRYVGEARKPWKASLGD